MKKTSLSALILSIAAGSAQAETTMGHISMQVVSYRSFAAANLCHVNSGLYGQVLQQREKGISKSALEEKLDVASAPAIQEIIDTAYRPTNSQVVQPEDFYKSCIASQQAVIQKEIAGMSAK
ncbi:hypothetical protein [Pseudomonas koreensis]|uniref:hypothetical protein n=1 Tax=Pseudomonas koreensis TaxID=198620 RepID=UPI003D95BB13